MTEPKKKKVVRKKKLGWRDIDTLNLTFKTIGKSGFPKREGRYLVRAATADPNIPFYGIGFFLPKGKDETEEWGFWVYPEEFIPFIESYAFLG